ncbi:MAG TPA: hypothetical protein VHA76_16280 [Solirubrobacterales bacterium]|nr:hypothetical protein [Solirubrobacterales bacterium]
MQGAPRRSARSFFVLPLVLALLAFVALPALAQAEPGTVYETEPTNEFKVPNTEKNPSKPKHKSSATPGQTSEAKAHASENAGGGGTSPEEESEGGGKEKSQAGGVTGGPSEGGGNKPGGGEGSKSSGNGGGTKDRLGGSEKVSGGGNNVAGKPVSQSTSSGSSPVVPILIAVVVLAAISIGVVLYRQRKSGGQGPDRRVSSPNAS